ncbi:MAG: CvpA family protein [Pseudomonadota bacterium]
MGSEFSWAVDAVVIVLVVVSAYLAMVRGVFRELFALASWVAAFFVAFYFTSTAHAYAIDLPVLGDLLRSCGFGMLITFILVFGATLIVCGIVIWLFSSPSSSTTISAIDQVLGLVYGAVRGLVLVAVLLLIYQNLTKSGVERLAMIDEAAVYPYLQEGAAMIDEALPEEYPSWFEDRVNEAQAECAARLGVTGA